ncbi:MAG: hypothetical protein IAF58_06735, partial [Leptolyngbya sp.]|nr:hypothetical protein [Candidatus Melainabacteria bacterium]
TCVALPEIELYYNSNMDAWAIYHPVYCEQADTECLYINIQTEEQARNLVDLALNLTQAVDLAAIGMPAVQARFQPQGQQTRLYLWHCYHPDNWQPSKVSGKTYAEPPIAGELFYMGEAEDEEDRFDGYFFATCYAELPIMTDYWRERGWRFKSAGTITEVSPGLWRRDGGDQCFSCNE